VGVYVVAIRRDLHLKFSFPSPRKAPTRISDVLEAHVNIRYTLSACRGRTQGDSRLVKWRDSKASLHVQDRRQ
jgi:hypothetical protein